MEYSKTSRTDHAVVTVTREEYVFEDGEIWWRYATQFKDPERGEMKRDSWVVNSKTGQSRQSELERKISDA